MENISDKHDFFMTKYLRGASTRINIRPLIVFFTALSLLAAPVKAQADDYIIVYKNHLQKKNMLMGRPAFTVSRSFNIIPAVAAQLDANQVKQLRQNPNVAYIEPDYKIYALGSPDSSLNIEAQSSSQTIPYGVTMVSAPPVWPRTKGATVRVAVLDTGISMYHPDRGNVVTSVSFVPGVAVEDFHGHGTHTSGTIAAADNDIGVVGVAPQADLLIAKVIDNNGTGLTSWVISGIEWAVNNNAKVISMSIGDYDYSAALDTACDNAFAAGVLLVAAAGNDNTSTPLYPAALDSVISVAAIDQSKNKASFSNFGPTIDLAAPGVSVYSTVPVSTVSPTADAVWSSTSHQANILIGTALGSVSGTICNCGLADGNGPENTCPDSVAGNIAHIRRGIITFAAKVAHAQSKGAIGVIISNNVSGNFNGTLGDETPLVVVSISQTDGNELQTLAESGITGSVSVTSNPYAYLSGTSMACPHVAGVATLIISAADDYNITPQQVSDILFDTAQDLGTSGRDDIFGYGLVDAYAALQLEKMNLLAILTDYWLQSCSEPSWCDGLDSDHSGRVDFIDFAAFAQNW